MFTYRSPQEFAAKAKKLLLPALRYHFADPHVPYNFDYCVDCPYWSGPNTDYCNDHFIMFLPDLLRRYDDPRAAALADRLDICNAYLAGEVDETACAGCEHYVVCHAEDDPDPVISDVYDFLVDLGVYEE